MQSETWQCGWNILRSAIAAADTDLTTATFRWASRPWAATGYTGHKPEVDHRANYCVLTVFGYDSAGGADGADPGDFTIYGYREGGPAESLFTLTASILGTKQVIDHPVSGVALSSAVAADTTWMDGTTLTVIGHTPTPILMDGGQVNRQTKVTFDLTGFRYIWPQINNGTLGANVSTTILAAYY